MKPLLKKAILDYFGAESMDEVFEDHIDELYDNVVPGFCKSCAAYYGQVEPDARGYECDNCGELDVSSVVEILLF